MQLSKKTAYFIIIAVIFTSGATLGWFYFNYQNNQLAEEEISTDLSSVDSSDNLQLEEYINTIEEGDLTEEEKDGLILMREEEKLARDVYTTLYNTWGQNVFQNISESEQTHMDTVKTLLDKYSEEDPVTDDTVGVFTNNVLADLYEELTEKGILSLTDALTVGATIEDLDIKDLEDLMAITDNEDILAAYQNLQKGSRNHIRSFTTILSRNGEIYTPVYITEEEYQEIITTPSETGVTYDSTGQEM